MADQAPTDANLRRFVFAMDAAGVGAWDWNIQTGEVWWSPNLPALHGIDPSAFDGTFEGFVRLIHPDDRDRVVAAINRALETGEDYLVEFRVTGADGRTRWIQGKGRVLRDETGAPVRMLGVGTDVTSRREAESARLALAAIVESSNEAIITRTLDGIITSWNPAAERLYGYTAEEMIGKPISLLIPPDRQHELEENLEQARRGEHVPPYETVRRRRDGTLIDVSVSVSPIMDDRGRIIGAATFTRDETERRRATERLRMLAEASRAFAETAFDLESTLQAVARHLVRAIGDGCIMRLISDDGQWLLPAAVEYADPRATQYTREFLATISHGAREGLNGQVVQTGEPIFLPEIDPPTLAALVQPDYHAHLAQLPTYGMIIVPLRARGRVIGTVALSRLQPGRAYTPADLAFVQQFADHAALAVDNARLLRDSQLAERRYRALFESLADAVVVFDDQLRFLDANTSTLTLLGYSWDELATIPLLAIVNMDEAAARAEVDTLKREGRWHGELEVRHRDGHLIPVEAMATTTDLNGVTAFLASWRDITERRMLRRLQEDILAMVSHDLRGPLTVLRASAQLLHRRATTGHRAIQTILRQADRMNRRSDDLSGIVQLETGTLKLNLQDVDLVALARREAEAIQAQTDRHVVRVESNVPAAIGMWDPERLGQVLQNVLDNAVKYSPEGGEILVRITSAPGEIRLSVSDQGAGIAPADLPRLFERYYRAHSGNHTAGLGLGLYIARMLVEAHGGRIWAESIPGQGSTFTIVLPHKPPHRGHAMD